jgi:GNAT superfamily N-acetyltransferase
VDAYVRDVAGLPTFAAGRDGFLALKQHTDAAAEIYVMGVRPESHRRGLGTALLEAAEAFLREREVEYLQVEDARPFPSRRGIRGNAELLRGARVPAARRSSPRSGARRTHA